MRTVVGGCNSSTDSEIGLTTMKSIDDYYSQIDRLGQVETYDGFWWKLVNKLAISRYWITIFRHRTNKQVMLNITLEDLIWLIGLTGFFIGVSLGIVSYYHIYNQMEAKYAKDYYWNRQYDERDYRLPTEHPDYIRVVHDIVPSRDMAIINKFILARHYPQATNYAKVVNHQMGYVMEVSDEDFKNALREFRHQKLVEIARRNGTMK